MAKYTIYLALLGCLFLIGCGNGAQRQEEETEDANAKAMLEGIWIDANEGDVSFCVRGDTIYYPDSTSRAVSFRIIRDTLVLEGSNISKYRIIRQEEDIFEFENGNGDVIRLVKSENPSDSLLFVHENVIVINQNTLIKRDTVVNYTDKRYHCYVQVNPTTYQVYKSSYNDDGLEVENVYYDNIVHISIYSGANSIFSKDFRKSDFSYAVPNQMLDQCILSDIVLDKFDDKGFRYQAQLGIPDSQSYFIADFTISYEAKIKYGNTD
ncbi:MAG: DUF4738 domain-containing protein [Prevotella sp.]|nr:DUF4738 domain-containing protein [Prevotella sp.]